MSGLDLAMREVRRNMPTDEPLQQEFALPNFGHGSGACGAKFGMSLAFDNCVKAARNNLVPSWEPEYIGARNG
jgi:hypothetical protein